MRKLTVVIPCRNEKQHIAACVEAIYACSLPEDVVCSIFVVDGMSDDGTRPIIGNLQKRFPTLHLIDNTEKLTPFAFNLGIHAGGEVDFVQIVGARQLLSPNYLQKGIELLSNNAEMWCVGGKVENVYLNEQGRIIAQAMATSFGMGLGNFRTLQHSSYTDTVGTPMYRYEVFNKIGFFDEALIRNQDDDFNFRVTQAGGKIFYCHEMSLKYFVRGSIQQLGKQFMQYGYWKVFVNRKHKSVTTTRQLIPPAFVLFLIFVPVLFLVHTILGLAASFFLVLYIFLGIFVALQIGSNWKESIQIFQVFPILHIAYGYGYLRGMIDFILLNKQPSENAKSLSR